MWVISKNEKNPLRAVKSRKKTENPLNKPIFRLNKLENRVRQHFFLSLNENKNEPIMRIFNATGSIFLQTVKFLKVV